MKQAFYAVLFCVCLAVGFQARCITLPAACGDDKVQFNVTTQSGLPAPAPPAAGKAQVVFIESVYGLKATVRIGMDGAWVGADKRDSYFPLDVTPGLHHLCASWQSSDETSKRGVELFALNAEPGKVYYLQVKATAAIYDVDFTFAPLNEDEAVYLIQTSPLSSTTRRR